MNYKLSIKLLISKSFVEKQCINSDRYLYHSPKTNNYLFINTFTIKKKKKKKPLNSTILLHFYAVKIGLILFRQHKIINFFHFFLIDQPKPCLNPGGNCEFYQEFPT